MQLRKPIEDCSPPGASPRCSAAAMSAPMASAGSGGSWVNCQMRMRPRKGGGEPPRGSLHETAVLFLISQAQASRGRDSALITSTNSSTARNTYPSS